MSKFNRTTARARILSPLASSGTPTTNHYGATGFKYDLKTELFLLAVSNMVSQDTFYEKSETRDCRYTELVSALAFEEPQWIARFLSWLRNDARMRSAALVGALEAAHAMIQWKVTGAAGIVESVLQRADEPGEAVAYWRSRYGKALPKPVKRGIAVAAARLYTQFSALKYDSDSKGYRFADVIRLCHVRPSGTEQTALFRWLVDERVTHSSRPVPMVLTQIVNNRTLRKAVTSGKYTSNRPGLAGDLKSAGMTWEDSQSLFGQTGQSKKDVWEAQIPSMGYMALLRNLRNFDIAGVSDEVAEKVAARLSDPEQVKRSRQLPYRFYSAYKSVRSDRWSWALSKALNVAVSNIPAFAGRTLVLVDMSPSMYPGYGGYYNQPRSRDALPLWQMAALFGTSVALRAESADLYQFGGTHAKIPFQRGDSVLKTMEEFSQIAYTDIARAVVDNYHNHDRVVIFTDEQTGPGWTTSTSQASLQVARYIGPAHFDALGQAVVDVPVPVDQVVPAHVPIFTWNLGGYQFSHLPDTPNRYTFGGLSEAAFSMIGLIERGSNADWPF